jgi:hypothetical protein
VDLALDELPDVARVVAALANMVWRGNELGAEAERHHAQLGLGNVDHGVDHVDETEEHKVALGGQGLRLQLTAHRCNVIEGRSPSALAEPHPLLESSDTPVIREVIESLFKLEACASRVKSVPL